MSEEKEKPKPKWYTIKEASKYLSIGEPTMYRWMRDHKITFRKIGDSTRFLREDLDAFVQVFPSKQDVAHVKSHCPLCHSEDLIDGVYRTTGLNYFRPKATKFWSFLDSNIKSEGKMCTHCGHIILFGDVSKLESVKKKRED